MGFTRHHVNYGMVCTHTCYGYSVCGYGYGVGNPNPWYTCEKPYWQPVGRLYNSPFGPFHTSSDFSIFFHSPSIQIYYSAGSSHATYIVHLPTFQPSSTHHTRWDGQRCCSGSRLGNWQGKVMKYEFVFTSINCIATLYSSYQVG